MSTWRIPSSRSSISGGGGGGGKWGGGWRCKGGGGRLFGCRAHRTLCHTQSSSDMSRGFTYSKPSNSDWSIFSITRLRNFVKLFYFIRILQHEKQLRKSFGILFAAKLALDCDRKISFSLMICNFWISWWILKFLSVLKRSFRCQ